MGITVPMPAWLRAWQQTWYGQILMIFLVGYGGALLTEGAFKNGLFAVTSEDLMAALSTYVLVQLAVWIRGHTLKSTMFASDGTTIEAAPMLKELVDNQVLLQAKADDKTSPVTQGVADEVARVVEHVANAVDVQNAAVKAVVANEVKP